MRRIAIVGLGLIGGSLGMGLKQAYGRDMEIVGHDSEPTTAKKAQQMGAIDQAVWNLFTAVEGAQMVVLATPVMAVRDLLELIGPHLAEGCIVTDTASTKQEVLSWADTFLPGSVSFVGGDPLTTKGVPGIEGARPDLCQDALYCLCPSSRAHQDAVQVVTDMVKALGARPYFIDAAEHDSYAAAVNQLPLVLSSALVTAAAKTESWRDISKQAAAAFEDLSRLAAQYPLDNLDACMTNKQALLHWLNQAIYELIEYRHLLEKDTEGLGRRFAAASSAREQWLGRRAAGFPPEEGPRLDMPGFGERMGDLLVGQKLLERYHRIEELRQRREKGRPRRARE